MEGSYFSRIHALNSLKIKPRCRLVVRDQQTYLINYKNENDPIVLKKKPICGGIPECHLTTASSAQQRLNYPQLRLAVYFFFLLIFQRPVLPTAFTAGQPVTYSLHFRAT
jgi:hypothetical protein